MTDWPGLLKRVKFGHLVPEVTVRYADGMHGSRNLVVTREVRDRATGEWVEVSAVYPAPSFHAERAAVDYVRHLVVGNLAHEVDECMTLDGALIRDPHQ